MNMKANEFPLLNLKSKIFFAYLKTKWGYKYSD